MKKEKVIEIQRRRKMTTKELKNKIIKRNEKDEKKIFDRLINFEGEIRNSNIKELANDSMDSRIIKILQQGQEIYWKKIINDIIDRLGDFITKEEKEDKENG